MRPGTWLTALLVLACLSVAAFGQGAAPEGEARLEWNLKKDDRLFVESKVTADNTLEALGKEAKEKTERTTLLRCTVLERSEQGMTLEEQIDSIALAVRDETPVNRFGTALKETRFKLMLDAKMKVVRLEGYGELLHRLAADDAEVRKNVQTLFSEDSLKHGVETLFQFLPDAPVKVGATWNRESTDKLGTLGECKRITSYRYAGKEKLENRELDKITFTGSVVLTADKPMEGSLPYQIVKADLKGDNLSGTIYFDSSAGRLVRPGKHVHLQGNDEPENRRNGGRYEDAAAIHGPDRRQRQAAGSARRNDCSAEARSMKSVRIGNGCGFWGDNLDAPVVLAERGRLHYLTLEYLAELTMSILALQKQRNPDAGFAGDFLDVLQRLGPVLHAQPQLKIITNAGGMNPDACAGEPGIFSASNNSTGLSRSSRATT